MFDLGDQPGDGSPPSYGRRSFRGGPGREPKGDRKDHRRDGTGGPRSMTPPTVTRLSSPGMKFSSRGSSIQTTPGTNAVSTTLPQSTTNVVSTSFVSSAAVGSQSSRVGLAVGLSVAGLVLLALVIVLIMLYRRRHKLPAFVKHSAIIPRFLRRTSAADIDERPTSGTDTIYEEIRDPESSVTMSEPQSAASAAGNNYSLEPIREAPPPPIYAKPQKRYPASSSVAAPGIADATGPSSVYSARTITLIDNTLYGAPQPSVTSSDDDVTDLTVIDNDLYELEGQGQKNSDSTDYESTLIDNDLYS